MVAFIFAPSKGTARGISDFRADINRYLGRSSEELPYPRAACLENAPKENVWVSEWDWRLAGSRHLALNQTEWIVVSGESVVELERCTDHLGVGGIIETGSSFTETVLWYSESLRFLAAEFSIIFIFKKLYLPGTGNRL